MGAFHDAHAAVRVRDALAAIMEGGASLGPFPGVAAKIVQFFAVGAKRAARLGGAACGRSREDSAS